MLNTERNETMSEIISVPFLCRYY